MNKMQPYLRRTLSDVGIKLYKLKSFIVKKRITDIMGVNLHGKFTIIRNITLGNIDFVIVVDAEGMEDNTHVVPKSELVVDETIEYI